MNWSSTAMTSAAPWAYSYPQIAAKWKGVAEENIAKDDRDWAKEIAYGLMYGKGVESTADAMGCDPATAKERMQSFIRMFPDLDRWMQRMLEDARKHKPPHVITIQKRQRILSDLNSKESHARSAAERKVVNTICQVGNAFAPPRVDEPAFCSDVALRVASMIPHSHTRIPGERQHPLTVALAIQHERW